MHHYHYTNVGHGLKMVYVKLVVVGTQKPYRHKVYRDLKPHFLKFKAGIQTTIL